MNEHLTEEYYRFQLDQGFIKLSEYLRLIDKKEGVERDSCYVDLIDPLEEDDNEY